MLISAIAKQLSKDEDYITMVALSKGIKIYNDPLRGYYITSADAEKLLQEETETPTRYTKHGRECKDIIRDILGSDGLHKFYIGNVIKYLYRNNSIGDLNKARTYLDMLIKEVEDNDSNE